MKIKLGVVDKKDLKNYHHLSKDRHDVISSSYTDNAKLNYNTDNLVNIFHPKSLKVKVKNIIIENQDTKTFILEPIEEKELPPFKPGQYIIVDIIINNQIFKRAYSLASSPKNLKNYALTIKQVRNSYVSTYWHTSIKENTILTIYGPYGNFTYQPIRDQKNILALVGGIGITPIMSMARAINDGILDCNLTILYGAREESDLVFKKELDKLTKNNSHITVQYILSDEASTIYENGLINKETILKYPIGEYSYFVCGPTLFYIHLNNIFKELDIPNKYIRHNIYKIIPDDIHHIEHKLTIITNDKTITTSCFEDETLLESLEKASIYIPRKCMVGECGFCRTKLIKGEIKTTLDYVSAADKKYNYIHPCVTYPLSDITVKLFL